MKPNRFAGISRQEATQRYTGWLTKRMPRHAGGAVVPLLPHPTPWHYFQQCYHRWLQLWLDKAGELHDVTVLPSVGNLSVDNFGTWRDAEGRLCWGVYELDEACRLPWTQDIVRLATSAVLALEALGQPYSRENVCELILEGYLRGLSAAGKPLILESRHAELRIIVTAQLRSSAEFWAQLKNLPDVQSPLLGSLKKALLRRLPDTEADIRVVVPPPSHSGHFRVIALLDHQGGWMAREAKATPPSALSWLTGKREPESLARELNRNAVRSVDPRYYPGKRWRVRRLSPDCGPMPVEALRSLGFIPVLLESMGIEAANLHLGSRKARGLREEVLRLPAQWLLHAVNLFTSLIQEDWENEKHASPLEASSSEASSSEAAPETETPGQQGIEAAPASVKRSKKQRNADPQDSQEASSASKRSKKQRDAAPEDRTNKKASS
ncbi:MAG: DUF2252 family protein [Myxococcota bacterium]